MKIYDVAVIGAGPAGCMSAIRSSQLKKNVVLLEKNDRIGKKLLLTGKGRCNLTNSAPLDIFIEKFGKQGLFLRSAFLKFFNQDLVDFFQAKGLQLKTERQGRVFPVTDKSYSVIEVIKKYLSENRVKLLYNARLLGISKKQEFFQLNLEGGNSINSGKVILATGGVSYKATGSTGDGFRIAKKLGHTITGLIPALVPLKTKEPWVRELQGLTLKNIRIILQYGNKRKIISDVGELMFTHFGVSGPLILDLSGRIITLLRQYKQVSLIIDLKPGLTFEQLQNRLLNEFSAKGKTKLKNIMPGLLPRRLIPLFMNLSGLSPEKRTNQITHQERRRIIELLKSLPLTVNGFLSIEEAMITAGGVSTKEINPRTMESRIVPGLYFAGEIIEGYASSGGYNLQQAFSTGYLAGESAAS